MMKQIIKYLFLGTVGGTLYLIIELLFRGYSFPSSFIMGFISFIFCGMINEILSWDTPLLLQALIGGTGITIIEFITGCIVNILLGFNEWDYSSLPLNILGQVCLLFSIIWCLLSSVAIVLDDYIRYFFFNEEKPRYKLF